MKNRIPALIAFIGAPFLGIDFYTHIHSSNQWEVYVSTRIFDILYMAGWICSILAFIRMKAAGETRGARNILHIQLLFLFLAVSSDIVALLRIPVPENVFFYWDLFWPISNCMMLVTGISIAVAGKLQNWKKFVPLLTGLWLPVCIPVKLFMPIEYIAYIGGTYSIIMWTLLAYVAFSNRRTESIENKSAITGFA